MVTVHGNICIRTKKDENEICFKKEGHISELCSYEYWICPQNKSEMIV